jgi:hypothetical protein
MSAIKTTFGEGGTGLQPGHGTPSLATALRDVADDLGDLAGVGAAWTTGLVVASHTVTLPRAGIPVAVEATTATSAGAKIIQSTAAPSAGYVRVTFTAGVATLLFNATDAVTAAAVLMAPRPTTIRTTKG